MFIEYPPYLLGHSTVFQFDRLARRSLLASLLVLMLGFAVFWGGLKYKLSLYLSEDAQRAIPAAKLLSESERSISNVQIERLLTASHTLRTVVRKPFHNASAALHADVRPVVFDQSETVQQYLDPDASQRLHIIRSNPRAPPVVV